MLIDYIFIPKGSTEVMGILKKNNPEIAENAWGDAEEQFAKWLTDKDSKK
jgi:hypothetical protein